MSRLWWRLVPRRFAAPWDGYRKEPRTLSNAPAARLRLPSARIGVVRDECQPRGDDQRASIDLVSRVGRGDMEDRRRARWVGDRRNQWDEISSASADRHARLHVTRR